jgi:hypothetical protein
MVAEHLQHNQKRVQYILWADVFTAFTFTLWQHYLIVRAYGLVWAVNICWMYPVLSWSRRSRSFSQWKFRHAMWHVAIFSDVVS